MKCTQGISLCSLMQIVFIKSAIFHSNFMKLYSRHHPVHKECINQTNSNSPPAFHQIPYIAAFIFYFNSFTSHDHLWLAAIRNENLWETVSYINNTKERTHKSVFKMHDICASFYHKFSRVKQITSQGSKRNSNKCCGHWFALNT